MLKPSRCEGCPFYTKGDYFVPDVVIPGSKVFFLAQNPGPDEELGKKLIKRHWFGSNYTDETQQVTPQPLIGATGQLFTNRFLPLSGLQRSQISVGNAIRCRPGSALGLKADELPTITVKMNLAKSKADIVKALKHCRDAYFTPPKTTELIVTMGRYAQFALTGIQNEESEWGKKQGVVESWRGYGVDLDTFDNFDLVDTSYYHPLLSKTKVFFTMHIAALYKGQNKRFFHATLQDFSKIGRLLAKKWPQPLPAWNSQPPNQWPSYAAFDTEYTQQNLLTRWSLCDTDYNLYCVEAGDTSNIRIPILAGSTVIMQNALADISHLANIVDFSQVNIEDMMLADSVLWTGEPHSLNFIASKHGVFNRYKHLAHEEGQQQLYSALDAYEPMQMWRNHYIPEFKRDAVDTGKLGLQSSWQVYKKYRLPLINIINKAQLTGARVNTSRLNEVQQILQEQIESIKQRAVEITSDVDFNIGGSKKLKEILYGV